jgi:hypothetical protein
MNSIDGGRVRPNGAGWRLGHGEARALGRRQSEATAAGFGYSTRLSLIGDSRMSSANGGSGRHNRHDSAGQARSNILPSYFGHACEPTFVNKAPTPSGFAPATVTLLALVGSVGVVPSAGVGSQCLNWCLWRGVVESVRQSGRTVLRRRSRPKTDAAILWSRSITARWRKVQSDR